MTVFTKFPFNQEVYDSILSASRVVPFSQAVKFAILYDDNFDWQILRVVLWYLINTCTVEIHWIMWKTRHPKNRKNSDFYYVKKKTLHQIIRLLHQKRMLFHQMFLLKTLHQIIRLLHQKRMLLHQIKRGKVIT